MNARPRVPSPANVLSHWYVLMDGVQFSAQAFYRDIEAELAARRVPRLHCRRIEYQEGSILSDRRVYLRLARERFAFEVCTAPFGTGSFFSLRFLEIPRGGWLQLLALLLAVGVALASVAAAILYATFWAGFWFWWILLAGAAVCLAVSAVGYRRRAARTAPDTALPPRRDLDAIVLGLPVIGAWYEGWRKDTYYRHDTRMVYHTLVSEIVKRKVEELTAAHGVKLLRTYEYSPILGELYKRSTVTPTDHGAGPS